MAPYSFSIEFSPSILRRIIDCVPVERHGEALEPDRFNLIEVVAHLADWEVLLLDRMVLAYEQPGSTVVVYDEGQRAIDKHYATRDIQHELDVFENRRRDTVDWLKSIPLEEWSRSFVHPERGVMSIGDQITMLLGHDLYHVEQATAYLR